MKRLPIGHTLKLLTATLLVAFSSWATALELKPFSAEKLSMLQQQGKPVAVHFHADWCATCVNQSKSLDTLKSDPQLNTMTVLVADYDKEKALRKSLKVSKQSVMVVFKGTEEITRVNGKTQPNDIKAAFEKAL